MKAKRIFILNSAIRHVAAPFFVLALASLAQAADKTWTGGVGNLLWDTSSANWSPSLWVGYDAAKFTATGAGSTIAISGSQSANYLSFEADNFTVQGGTLGLGSPSGGPSITVGTGLTATLGTTLTAAGGITNWNKNGLGTLVFASTDTTSNRTINLNAGTLRMVTGSQISSSGSLSFLNGTGTAAAFEMTGGTYSSSSSVLMGQNTSSQGASTFTQSGGSFTITNGGGNDFGLANWGGTSQLTVSGGTFSSAAFWGMTIGQRGVGILTISGTGSFTQTHVSSGIRLGGQGTGVGTANLDGGTLTTLMLGKGSGSGTMNFNGGTLKPTTSTTTFLQGLTRANVRNGGVVISTEGKDVTIGQALLHSNLGGDSATDGGLTKSGTGTLTLNAACTYTGNTTINAGTLALVGAASISSSPVIQVQAAGTLQGGSFGAGQSLLGTGSLDGNITMASGSILSPAGDGVIGSLSTGGALNLAGNIHMDVHKSGSTLTNDQITGLGSVVCGGTLTLSVTGDDLAVNDTFTLLANTGGISGAFVAYNLPSLPAGLSWDKSNLPVDGTIKVVDFVSTPFFTPAAGNYVGAQSVSITSDSGSTIYYTVDGSAPTMASPSGTSPVTGVSVPADSTLTVRAFAVKSGQADSPPATATYTTVSAARWEVDYDGNWSDSSVWLQNVIPDGAGAPVDFHTTFQTANTTVTLDTNRTVGSMTFGNTNAINWLIQSSGGSVLTLDSASPTIDVLNNSATISAMLAGSNGLVKNGPGTLILSNVNLYGGDTTVAAGTLKLGAANAIPDGAGKGNLSLTGTLDVNAFSDTINGLSGAGTVDKSAAGSSTLTVGGNDATSTFDGLMMNSLGTLALAKTGTGTLTLSNTHTYTGNTLVSGGVLELPAGAAIGSASSGRVEVNGGTLRISGGSVTGNGNGTVFLANSVPSTLELSAGSLTINAASQYWDVIAGSYAQASWNQTGGTANLNIGALYVSNNVGSAGSSLNLSGGSFSINGTAGTTDHTLILAVRANGTLNLSGSAVATIPVLQYGHSPAVSLAGIGGIINLDGGTLMTEIVKMNSAGTATFNFNGGLLKPVVNNAAFMTGLTTANVRNGGVRIDTNGHAITIGQALLHSTIGGDNATDGGLIKSGTGTLTLSGACTYTGATSVNVGTLALTGSITSATTVKDTATLTGGGTTTDSLTVEAGGTVAPGGSIGTLHAGAVSLSGNYLCEVDASTADVLDAAGDLTLSGATLTLSGTATANSYLIATYSGTRSGTFAADPAGYTVVYDDTLKQIRLEKSAGFSSWISDSAFDLAVEDQDPGDDPDHDGVNNLVEYALAGRSPVAADGPAGTLTGALLSFSKRPDASGITWRILESDDLGQTDAWQEVAAYTANDGSVISYTLPPDKPRTFARLEVTQAP